MTGGSGPAARLPRLRERMEQEALPALMVTNITNVQYLSGFTGSAGTLLITPARALIVVDSRYFLQAEREAPLFEMVKVIAPKKVHEVVAETVSALAPRELGFETSVSYGAYAQWSEKLPNVPLKPVKDMIERMRLVKDAEEIEHLRAAAAIADACFAHVLGFLRPGITERDVAVEIECFVRRQGARAESFETIVASGPQAASPHAHATDKVILAGELVKMDFGAIYQGYASDITRTVAVGHADDRQREVYGVVLEAQEAAIRAIRPGVSGIEVDKVARDVIAGCGFGDYFGHSLGHSLGRSVHDGAGFSQTSEITVERGMVMTVEPGIYIPDWGGVRIEDDILVTESGAEVLTRAPKEFTVVGRS